MPRLELFPFRFRDPITGRWKRARHKLELHELQALEEEWEITGAPDIHQVDPNARYFSPWPRPTGDPVRNVSAVLTLKPAAQPVLLSIAAVAG